MQCTLKDLHDFYHKSKIYLPDIEVKTRHGYKSIEAVAITARNSKQVKVQTTNKKLIGSPDHLLFKNNKWVKIKTLLIGDFIDVENGIEELIELEELPDRQDLYDLQVNEVKEFYANGIVSHNSTIKEVIEFALYGKVDGFTLTDLPNRANKALSVYIKFLSKRKKIEIERGISPSFFKLTINGKPYDEAGKKNIQTYIEDELFEIPYHIFKNIIVLSISSFKSFLTMTPKDKRNIIDRIFGFDVLNKMTEEVKSDKKDVEIEFTQLGYELNSILGTIEDLTDRLANIKTQSKNKQTDEIEDLKKKIQDYKKQLEPLEKQYADLSIKINKDQVTIDNKKTGLAKDKQSLISINKEYTLYSNDKCPQCGSDLTTKDHTIKKENLKQDLLKLKDIIVAEQANIIKLQKSFSTLNDNYHNTISDKTAVETQLKFYKNKIVDVVRNSKQGKADDDPNISGLKKMLDNYEIKKSEKEVEQSVFQKDKIFYKRVEELLSNNGIKQMVINNILPLLNNSIEESLKDLDVNFTVKIDSQFNAIVTSLGTEINVKTLSTGERARVDTSILLALIRLIKLQFPSLNILFLDEIFSNIDLESIDSVVALVKTTVSKLDINTFLVSHSPIAEVLFDKKITLTKSNTFSELEILEL